MKLLAVLFTALATIAAAQTRLDVTMIVDSAEREFIVQIPSGTAPAGGYPVVFMLHGTTDSGEVFYNTSGWKEKGEEEKFITVFPSSQRICVDEGNGPFTTTKWATGEVTGGKLSGGIACPGQNIKNDVTFFRRMIDTIKQALNVDAARIYATGFSSGGVMVSKLLIEMSDVFAAMHAQAGGLNENDSGAIARPMPFIYSIGTGDDQCEDYGYNEFPFNDTSLAIHRRLIGKYLGVLGLGETFTKDSTALVLRYKFNTLAATAGWEFDYLLFKGLEHKYPNPISYPISLCDILWPFFKQHSVPLAVKTDAAEIATIHLRPNPATDHLIIDDDATLTLFTATGTEILQTKTHRGQRFALPKLSPGIYLAKLATPTGLKAAKVVVR